MIGTVKSFDTSDFTGIISCEATGEEIRFSMPAIASQHYKMLHEGQRVNFYIEQGSQGNSSKTATKVTAID